LPRFRAKLPSRNWLIFLSITGSFASAVLYDRRQRKKAQERWCHLVSHLARESLPVNQLPRKFTIYLAAPPGDGLRAAREYFTEYVKPVLVSAAIEWDVVEGRREGDVRAGLAERIRTARKKNGEKVTIDPEVAEDEDLVEGIRQKAGIRPSDELEGDIVIGRHTWKEYVRGLHEGWLGPLAPPPEPPPILPAGEFSSEAGQSGMLSDTQVESEAENAKADNTNNPSSPGASEPAPKPTPKPIRPTPPYISPSQYPSSVLASTTPRTLPPAVILPFPHLLGFLNTPLRIYRFLTQRYLTDEIGHMVADMEHKLSELD
jgi:import inner membrane translocase subunit TIM54